VKGEPAPLVPTPGAALPKGGYAEWYHGAGGLRLRAALFPAARPIGSVVLSPGRTEHIEKYVEVINELVSRGFTVLAHDWRGQGLSSRLLPDRLRGHAEGFEDFTTDFKVMLDLFETRLPRPWMALSHSMGGCLTLLALAGYRGAAPEARFSAAIFSAPMLGIRTVRQLGPIAAPLAWTLSHIGLSGGYSAGGAYDPTKVTFEADHLNHDRARYDRSRRQVVATPDLQLGAVTWGWVDSAVRATQWLAKPGSVEGVQIPLVIVAAGDEHLVDNGSAQAIAARLPHGRYLELPGAYHEILMETDDYRAAFWREFDALAGEVGLTVKRP
jgi:lysophospholipase